MKARDIKISYEPEADILAWEVSKQSIDHAQEMGNMVIHFSKNNAPVFVEMLEASKFLGRAEKLLDNSGHKVKV